MPLLAVSYPLQFYGPGLGAGFLVGVGSGVPGLVGRTRLAASVVATGAVTGRATRLVNRPATALGVASVPLAQMRARALIGATIRVNDLSQDDITGAVLEALVEPDLSLKEAVRLMLAVLVGRASGSPGTTIRFRDPSGSKERVVATVDGNGNRLSLTLDPSNV